MGRKGQTGARPDAEALGSFCGCCAKSPPRLALPFFFNNSPTKNYLVQQTRQNRQDPTSKHWKDFVMSMLVVLSHDDKPIDHPCPKSSKRKRARQETDVEYRQARYLIWSRGSISADCVWSTTHQPPSDSRQYQQCSSLMTSTECLELPSLGQRRTYTACPLTMPRLESSWARQCP